MSTLDKLISSSVFFKRGIFNHTNADILAKQLIDNGFFKANHKVTINTRTGDKIISEELELRKAIEEEKIIYFKQSRFKKII
ncbi:MAG: hypothetical protein LBR09_00590 [Endomicrobium sp.]|jgi:hypothetical protein|nr:hypothetical protein [Endomicrobium sp.]